MARKTPSDPEHSGPKTKAEPQSPPSSTKNPTPAPSDVNVRRPPVPDQSAFKFLTFKALLQLPPIRWLIRKLIALGTFVVVFGEPSSGKSFVVLDIAMSVATGRSWAGLRVRRGRVLYVVAEGGAGARQRVAAWCKHNGLDPGEDVRFLLSSVEMNVSGVRPLIDALRDEGFQPDVIIIDTLNQTMVGDENSAKDMGEFVKAAKALQRAFSATAFVVHHTGKRKPDGSAPAFERGSSALRAAADTMIKVTFDERTNMMTVLCDKQKDAEKLPPIHFRRQQVHVGVDEDGEPETSLVLVHEAGWIAPQKRKADGLSPKALVLLKVLAAAPGGELATSDWEKASVASGIPGGTYRRHRQKLVDAKLVMETSPDEWRILPRGSAIASGAPELRHDPDVGPASAITTPVGGGVGGDVGDDEDEDPYDGWEFMHDDDVPDEEEPK